MKKVLILGYYWPPSPGAGAQRIFSFARYLPEYGYKPYIITPPTAGPPTQIKGIGTHSIVNGWDPTRSMGKNTTNASNVKTPSKSKLAEWIRLNIFIPDTKIGWYLPAIKQASTMIEEVKPDILFTSAPPYTIHLVGKALHCKYDIPWVADFRDPWLENHAYNTAPQMPWARWLNRKMEHAVLCKATHITTALETQRGLLAKKTDRSSTDITTINNGFDHKIWEHVNTLESPKKLYLSHFGTIYEEGLDQSSMDAIVCYISEQNESNDDMVFRLFGNIPNHLRQSLKTKLPEENLEYSRPVSHDTIEHMLTQQQILLLIVNHGATHAYSHPSKVFEYMASGNPILVIGPDDHEVMQILQQHAPKRAYICKNAQMVTKALDQLYQKWAAGNMPSEPDRDTTFSRQNLTQKLAETFSGLLNQ